LLFLCCCCYCFVDALVEIVVVVVVVTHLSCLEIAKVTYKEKKKMDILSVEYKLATIKSSTLFEKATISFDKV